MDPLVRDRLLELGATPDEIERAEAESRLPVLVVERLLFPGSARYGPDEIATIAGVDPELTDRLWRAMGFPDVPAEHREFTDADIAALKRALERFGERDQIEVLVQQTRVLNASMARVAETWTDVIQRELAEQSLSDESAARTLIANLDIERDLELADYVLRRQILAAVRRRFMRGIPGAESVTLTVGFVDLVGFTSLSLQVSPAELANIVAKFEAVAFDTIATNHGQVVKTIGDEVMFVSDVVADAGEIALTLAEKHADDETMPDVRAGLAFGEAIPLEGDYYGPVVNLASRVVSVARRGTVVIDDDVRAELRDHDEFKCVDIGTRNLKDVGRRRLWALRRGHVT
jgi:adenylate cyclase